MNRTQHLIASQPRPERRLKQPGVCSFQVVDKPKQAANDEHRLGNSTFSLYSHKTRAALILKSRREATNGPRGVK